MKILVRNIVSCLRILKRDGLWRLLRLLWIKFVAFAARFFDFVRGRQPAFNPYDHLLRLKPIPCDVVAIDYDMNDITIPFSLITTIKNESSNIIKFLKSIECQSVKPDEVVIVDGGSTDNTLDLINGYLPDSSLLVSVIRKHDINISEGRNIALAACRNEIVVLTDAGCWMDEHFCKNIVGLFEDFPDADLAGGIWFTAVKTRWNLFMPFWEEVMWDSFLPSGRAMAVKKSLSKEIGGFPEYLTLTGEDTLFNIVYRRVSKRWVYNRRAFVYWQSPTTKEREQQVAFSYGKGDGESGVGDFSYYPLLGKSSSAGRFACISPQAYAGYLEGRRNRSFVEIEKRKVAGLVLILSDAPLTDAGGELRSARQAVEFIKNNWKVVFVSLFPSHEDSLPLFMDMDYSLLELYSLADFDCEELAGRYRDLLHDLVLVIDSLHPAFIPVVAQLKKAFGGSVRIKEVLNVHPG